MKFIDFGKQLAKPIKFIKQRTVFLPKPLQQAVVFLSIIITLPVFLIGFMILQVLTKPDSTVSYTEENLDSRTYLDDSEDSKLEDLWNTVAYQAENQVDGYRDGQFGFGFYVGDYLISVDETGDLEL